MATDPSKETHQHDSETDDSVPVFSSWKGWYFMVIGFLLFQILLYLLMTRYLS